jgi:hypothetical protein
VTAWRGMRFLSSGGMARCNATPDASRAASRRQRPRHRAAPGSPLPSYLRRAGSRAGPPGHAKYVPGCASRAVRGRRAEALPSVHTPSIWSRAARWVPDIDKSLEVAPRDVPPWPVRSRLLHGPATTRVWDGAEFTHRPRPALPDLGVGCTARPALVTRAVRRRIMMSSTARQYLLGIRDRTRSRPVCIRHPTYCERALFRLRHGARESFEAEIAYARRGFPVPC